MFSISIYSGLMAALFTSVGAQTTTVPVTGILGNATVLSNNPVGAVYTASLPAERFFTASGLDGNIKGSISATANPDGVGVSFTVDLSNFPASGGPFRMLSSP
jgi:hypothetical protein